jgi:hypothetical protein
VKLLASPDAARYLWAQTHTQRAREIKLWERVGLLTPHPPTYRKPKPRPSHKSRQPRLARQVRSMPPQELLNATLRQRSKARLLGIAKAPRPRAAAMMMLVRKLNVKVPGARTSPAALKPPRRFSDLPPHPGVPPFLGILSHFLGVPSTFHEVGGICGLLWLLHCQHGCTSAIAMQKVHAQATHYACSYLQLVVMCASLPRCQWHILP